MNEKRFWIDDKENIYEDNGYTILNKYAFGDKRDWSRVCERLNEQHQVIADLKTTLNQYRQKMSCSNCHYHNYDWFDDGDEFEVCDKGNNDGLSNGFCPDWREL